MKKFAVFMVTAALLLAGCAAQSPAPVETPPAESPDIDALVQQSVDEAMARYEEEQRAKDEEIEKLKDQLEALASQAEEGGSDSSSEDTGELAEPLFIEETVPENKPVSQAETLEDPEPEPEPLPSSNPAPPKSNSSSEQGFDLWTMYPSFVFDDAYREDEVPSSEESCKEETEEGTSFGEPLEDEAQEVIRLTNMERESRGLEALEMDDDLMALAQIRAEEVSIKYSHERPDGTRVVKEHPGFGENVGAKASAEKQVTSWMNSEGHRANMLRERFHHIGVGCYRAANGTHYWVQIFSP